MLKISDNGRFIIHADGRPFFYLADTAWELFHRLTLDEAGRYLRNRAAKGFNVVQAVALAELDGLKTPNSNGDVPLVDLDPTRPNEPYWRHVDSVVRRANELGIYISLLPTWGDKYNKLWGAGPEIFTEDNARVFGQWIAARYANNDIIWMLGGDRPLLAPNLPIIRAMAEGIRASVGHSQLITFHPCGGEHSSTYVGAELWIDFHTIQSGHVRDRDNPRMIDLDYRRLPTRPVLDAEPGYEDHPDSFNVEKGWLDEHDVRKSLYWSVFAGACGYTYGCHDIWQMRTTPETAVNLARRHWSDALDLPGAGQVRHCKALVESRPYLRRVPDLGNFGRATLVISTTGTTADHIRTTVDADGTYAFIYLPVGQRVTVDLTRLTGQTVRAWWFNPRNGTSELTGDLDKTAKKNFFPPISDLTGRDWVLVLDDASRAYGRPGMV